MLEVITAGLLSSVQDCGRPGYTELGVPVGGACDRFALAQANLLLGNAPGAAALELTLSGPELAVLETCTVGLAGAHLRAEIPEEYRNLAPRVAHLVRAGTTIRFGTATDGARAYLALAGGIAVPVVLGSAATYLAGGFGGFEGRALRAGDVLRPVRRGDLARAGAVWPRPADGANHASGAVRLLPGPHVDRFAAGAFEALAGTSWHVDPESDRTGVRLRGPALEHRADGAEIVSQPMVWGAVQVPPDGQPICLLADHETVGGYPVLAVVISADLPLLGQLAPGAQVRFAATTLDEAERAYREQQQELVAAAETLGAQDSWDALPEAIQG